jgi:hypothetical protein
MQTLADLKLSKLSQVDLPGGVGGGAGGEGVVSIVANYTSFAVLYRQASPVLSGLFLIACTGSTV